MVSRNPDHLCAESLELWLMTVYQQSSQVEAWFSTADYSWILLMTAAVIMVLRQHFFLLFAFQSFCCVFLFSFFWAPVSASRL